ncbi:MAG TPA: DNA starvation/stationary phase protection protein Dps [Aggregatilineales bacterium]|nr:DNA starvation/stationary phase protection protein Dps [Aggregatilineales bacterium]
MATKKAPTFKTSIDLPAKTRESVIVLLNQQLADTFDLLSQTKQAHWNVKGMNFIALHKLFDELVDTLEDQVDEIAERVTALGGLAMGTARMAAANSTLPEFPTVTAGEDVVKALVERYAALAKSTRAAIDTADKAGDADTADLFTGVSRDLDKHLWFLEAHLQ